MINVIWYDGAKGNWDSGLLESIFDKHENIFIQFNTKIEVKCERAIVIVVGKPAIEPLRKYLETLKSGIVILTSEEDAFFDWKAAIPKHLDVWTQYYSPTTKSEIKERILLGPPNRIKDYKINTHLPKKYLWSFIGQNQNPFREQCINVLSGLPDGYLKVTDAFGGYGKVSKKYQEYLDTLCQSYFVFTPSGSMNCDSFRFYESILCGAIPITDKRCPRDAANFDYWKECGVYEHIMSVDSWNNFKIPQHWIDNWDELSSSMGNWWNEYKQSLEQKLLNIANG